MKKNNFLELCFIFLFLSFWGIIWYKWIAIAPVAFDFISTIVFSSLAMLYILYTIFDYFKNKNTLPIILLYRISVLLTFISSLLSFVLFPTTLSFFYAKNLLAIICIYVSSKKLTKFKYEDGLVGILSSILLIVLEFLY